MTRPRGPAAPLQRFLVGAACLLCPARAFSLQASLLAWTPGGPRAKRSRGMHSSCGAGPHRGLGQAMLASEGWPPDFRARMELLGSDWTQGRFAVSLPAPKHAGDSKWLATKAVKNSVGPLLSGCGSGVAFIHLLNGTASLCLGHSSDEPRTATLTLPVADGDMVMGEQQDIFVALSSGSKLLTESGLAERAKGSVRFDFLLSVYGTDAEATTEPSSDGKGDTPGPARPGPAGGHAVVGPRDTDDFSALRQQALDQALTDAGVDVGELTTADEFFGTSALKAYNTFVRPRPKQLAKVMAEPLDRAAQRTMHQVAFLVRRHKADRAEYLRNKDAILSEAKLRDLPPPHPITLVCDNVRSAYNVGSIFRAADTAHVAEVVTCGLTPHPGGPGEDKIRKTAFSSLDTVASRHLEDAAQAVRVLASEGRAVYALETTSDAASLFRVDFGATVAQGLAGGGGGGGAAADAQSPGYQGPGQGWHRCQEEGGAGPAGRGGRRGGVALVLGNEVTGVDERVLRLCDGVVEIPVFGVKNSLNVASAAAVAMYEVLRQRDVDGASVAATVAAAEEGGGPGAVTTAAAG